ncbi:MAG: aminomethyl-transferring glycine dehydrogenase subunit GcvPB [Dehalococcoidia bacterium]|nr:aminomethyl-transferring glycine dehydrogenase subunit GcvPB [Dehalococcoidia bacterium]
MTEKLLSELSSPGRPGVSLPDLDVPPAEPLPQAFLRDELPLPELSQVDVVLHFVRLSQENFAVDTTFYPLGSCTMKHNPKVNEEAARLPGFTQIHPYQPQETVQGALRLMLEIQGYLAEITGLAATSLQPAAGAHGELTGMLMIRAYHQAQGQGQGQRVRVLVPDSAHGTNPSSAAMAGFRVTVIGHDEQGNVNLAQLQEAMGQDVAALMITVPSTLGLFERQILDVCRVVHDGGGLVYGDGANMNALLGWAKPGDLGFDVMHLNLHKTFSTPHGGGGPGSGPVCCRDFLAPFLPGPVVAQGENGTYTLQQPARSIGRMRSFYGNFLVLVRAYTYIRSLGSEGLRQVAENAVINANYLQHRLKDVYQLPYPRRCMHETVLSASRQKALGVRAWDIAKRLLDYGFYAPTVYFPLIVQEALMIEPTETESRETMDAFAEALLAIAREAEENPAMVQEAPHTTRLGRLDEVAAARKPKLRWG